MTLVKKIRDCADGFPYGAIGAPSFVDGGRAASARETETQERADDLCELLDVRLVAAG
jgi:hypothetical protein